jgi:hypothetical protein
VCALCAAYSPARASAAAAGVRSGALPTEVFIGVVHDVAADYLPGSAGNSAGQEQFRQPLQVLTTSGGRIWQLNDQQRGQVASGTYSAVRGYRQGLDTIRVQSEHVLAAVRPDERSSAVQHLSVLVILADWTKPDGTTPKSATNVVGKQTATWYAEVSHERLKLSAHVTSWLRVKAPKGCDFTTIGNEAQSAASRAGYKPARYTNIMIYFPYLASCGWAGLGYEPGTLTYINGDMSLDVVAHELGHNLGLSHANTVTCTGAQLVSSCTNDEYGNPFDVMGDSGDGSFDALQQDQLGWLPGGPLVVKKTMKVTLHPLESSDGEQAIEVVPNKSTYGDLYYLEYRRAVGADAGYAPNQLDGVMINVSQMWDYDYFDDFGATWLLQLGPKGAYALPAGSSWTAPEGITITVDSTAASGAVISIRFGTQPDIPTKLEAVPGRTEISLTWVPPTDVFDGKITGYDVTEYLHGQELNIVDTKSARATATLTGLKRGTAYSFTVSAYGPLGATDPPSRFTALVKTKT